MSQWKDFETLYRQHYTFLSLVAFKVLKDKSVAKDIVHDFFLSFWKKKDTIDIQTSFKAYASKAVKNMSLQYLEKLQKDVAKIEKMNPPKYENPPSLEKPTNGKESKIRELLGRLPKSRRDIFVDHIIHGLSYNEIAQTNNISINTVKTQMKRAYAFFREQEGSF
ncbi:RNA polymerase sigma-70 factor [Maribacter sp. 2304DJ31-5]|uniref:RNA polymerase sigma-70 factor n=1 Tax=Maribacter sp. 2304DJ31-5 TaxID=3386273 RepID=UPI0039BD8D71